MADWTTALVAGGLGLLGQNQANKAADQAAAANLEAARIAADAAAFKPYSVTTGLGSSYFNPDTQEAGYVLDPALQAWRDQYMTNAAAAMPQGFDTTANAQQYYNEIQSMMAPQRQAENLAMQQDLFGSGRLGLRLSGEGAGAGSGMVQPDVFGMNQARAQADAALAQQSRAQAQTEMDAAIARSTGMLQTGLGIEQLGLTPLELGGTFGGYGSNAGSVQANALLQGGMNAANANLAAGVGTMNMYKDMGLGLLGLNTPKKTGVV